MQTYYLIEAVRAKGRGYELYNDPTYFGKVLRSLMHLVDHGADNLDEILNFRNWDIEKLRAGDRYRHPNVYLRTSITTKENLVLEWYPAHGIISNVTSDFLYFTSERTNFHQPANRLVYIEGFEGLMGKIDNGDADLADEYLVEAVSRALNHVINSLKPFVNVTMITDLALEHTGDMLRGKLTKAYIYNVEERDKKLAIETRAKKLEEYFERMNLKPEVLLKFLQKAEGNYTKTSKLITEAKQLTITPVRLKEGAKRLFEHNPAFYNKHCSYQPLSEPSNPKTPTAKAQIFKFPNKN